MARITIDECLKVDPNRFNVALAITYRSRMLSQGHTPKVEAKRDKPAVIAIREIEEGHIDIQNMLMRVPT